MLVPLRGTDEAAAAAAAASAGRYEASLRLSPSFARLSERTQARHLSLLWRLTAALGRDVEWMLGNCDAAFEEILSVEQTNGQSLSEPDCMLTAQLASSLVAVLMHCDGEDARWPGARRWWAREAASWRAMARIFRAMVKRCKSQRVQDLAAAGNEDVGVLLG
jgi:hypothetical protein